MDNVNIFKKIGRGIKKSLHTESVTMKEQLGFASGIFGNTMTQDMIITFLMIFLTDFMGIAAKYILILLTISKIVNVLGSPVAGFIIDRTHSKWGQARPYTFFAPLPIAVTAVLLFVVPNISIIGRIIWVFIFFLIYGISDIFYDMSLLTVSSRITDNPKDRKNFYTLAEFGSTLGSMLPGGVIPILISLYAAYEQEIYLYATLFFAVIGGIMMFVPFFTLREKNLDISMKKVPIKMNAKIIWMDTPLLLAMLSNIVESLRMVTYASLLYFYKQTLGAYWLSTAIGAGSAALSYVGILLVPFLGRKNSPRNLMIGGFFFTALCYILLFITGYTHFWLVALLLIVSGMPNGMIRTSRRVLIADSTDYIEWKTWKKLGKPIRADAMIFAMSTLGGRINNLLKDVWLPLGLIIIGYVSAKSAGTMTINVLQSDKTIKNIFYLVAVPGIFGNLFAATVLLFDRFTGKRREDILQELQEIRKESKEKKEFNKKNEEIDIVGGEA